MTEKREESKIDVKYNLKLYWSVLRNYKSFMIGIILFILIIELANVFDRFLFKLNAFLIFVVLLFFIFSQSPKWYVNM